MLKSFKKVTFLLTKKKQELFHKLQKHTKFKFKILTCFNTPTAFLHAFQKKMGKKKEKN